MVANLLVSTVAMALGAIVAASPHRAMEIWGSYRLGRRAPETESFVRGRFGILLCLAGVLMAVDRILFSNYHH